MKDIVAAVQDENRLDALRETGLLDSEVEEEFDRLTRLASRLLEAPATFFSLVDTDRDFYKSCFGFDEPLASQRQLTGETFCHYSLVADGALVIPDTRADPLYAKVPTVESLGVAAYLGVPVRSPSGQVLGSFCAIDFTARDWTPLEVETMKELGRSAEREVAIRHWMARQTRLIEQERDNRLELERVMDSRARLIRGFTHDVKNPLGAADGFLSLMQDEIYGPLGGPVKDTITRVRRSIHTALQLIDDLITIARAEALDLDTARDPVDVVALAMDIATEYRAQAVAQNVSINVSAREVPPVLSDSTRIHQILGNLVSNALKYAPKVDIDIAVHVADEGESRFCAVAVSDHGEGIPAEHIGRLFAEFTRLEPERAEGAGLGLAISQRLAHALGGRIHVSSEPGVGSTFTLRLPVTEEARVGASAS
jgi:signal transduction histidine kinase